MEKINVEEIRQERIEHKISCDICGEYIATEVEYPDGYYDDHMYEIKQSNFDYIYRKQLCSDCIHKVNFKYIEMLKEFGFEPNTDW